MKTIALLCLLVFVIACSSSRDAESNMAREEARQLKKAQKEAVLQNQFDSISKVLESRYFVLEANFISNRSGRRIYVQSSLNFVKVDSNVVVLQIGSGRGMGYNGVGGITAQGHMSHWKLEKNDKKKSFDIELVANTSIGIYTVFMNVYATGDATASITGLQPGRLDYSGQIVPLDQSSLFTGRTY